MKFFPVKAILFMFFISSCGGIAPVDKASESTETPTTGVELATTESSAADIFSETGKYYVHEGGGFQFPMLKGWKGEQSDEGARITYPDGGLEIVVNRSSTGIELPHYALENFAFATEDSLYAGLDEYQLINVNSDAKGKTVTLEKIFEAKGGARYVYSQYVQKGEIVFTIEFGAPADEREQYRESFFGFVESIKFDDKLPEGTAPYQVRKMYAVPGDFFTYQVPASFYAHRKAPKEKTIIDTFISPDQTATIQIVSFDTGELINAETAERTAIKLLNELFEKGKGNINIDAIFTQKADGRRRMDWYSPLGEYAGSTYYELRGTFLILSTFAYEENSAKLFDPLMKDLAATYENAGAR